MCANSTPAGTGEKVSAGCFSDSRSCRVRWLLSDPRLDTKSCSGDHSHPPRVQLHRRVSQPWRALGTWGRPRGKHDREWLQVWASHRQRDILSRSVFLVCGAPPPQPPGFVPNFPQRWLDGDPHVAPLSGRHPVPLCCPGFPLENGGCPPTVGKDEDRGHRAKSLHPRRAEPPANNPSPQQGRPSAPRRGLR